METIILYFNQWLAPLLYMICFTGLTYSFLQAIRAGAESYASVHTEQTAHQFEDIFFFIPPKRILELAWTVAITSFVVLFFLTGDFDSLAGTVRGLIFGGVFGLASLRLPRWILSFLKKRRLLRFNEQLVDVLMTMSNALRSGSSILQSFEHIVKQNLNPISQEFSLFLQQTRVGVKFEDALSNLENRVDSEDLTLMIRSIEIARQTGGNLTEVFEKIAATIRERLRIQGRIQMLTAQGRYQGIIVGLMPVGLLIILFIFSPGMIRGFFSSSIGIAIGIIIIILECLGAFLIKKIITIDI